MYGMNLFLNTMFMPINGSVRVMNLIDSNDYLTISPFDLPVDTSAKPVVTLSITYIFCVFRWFLTISAWYVVSVPEACETLIPVKQTLSTR